MLTDDFPCVNLCFWTSVSSLVKLLKTFAVYTSVQLVISEWFFTSVSLAIENNYQNIYCCDGCLATKKRHILLALVNTLPLALRNSFCLLIISRERYRNSLIIQQPCKMPFT